MFDPEFDEYAVPGARFEDLDEALWRRFVHEEDDDPRTTLRKLRILTDEEDLGERASVAGVLMCSKTPERWFPNARVEAVRYRGTERDSKYQVDRDAGMGPADEQIRRAVAFVDRTMRRGATKAPERIEIPQFSLRAVFEAVVNAVAHRDYSIHRSKIRLFVFDDRLELYSPGALPNSLTLESLPLRQATRNELLTTLLGRVPVELPSETPIARRYFIEKRGEGVPIILRESRELSGRDPEYRLIDDEELLLTLWSAETPNF
jgi:ATP-dependent DNA helicase RecG